MELSGDKRCVEQQALLANLSAVRCLLVDRTRRCLIRLSQCLIIEHLRLLIC